MSSSSLRTYLALSIFLAFPASSVAQEWSAEQQEVLDAIDACIQADIDRDLQAGLDCTHDDFIGWRYDLPGLRDKSFADGEARRAFDSGDQLIGFSIQPLAVRLFGDIAIIDYYGYYYTRTAEGGDEAARWRWTDVMARDDGRWVWIADHGGADPGSGPAGPN